MPDPVTDFVVDTAGDVFGDISGADDLAEASENQAAATLQSSREARALNEKRYGVATDLMTPYINDSRTAQDQIMIELGLADGEAGTAYMNTPGYTSMIDETREGVEQASATGGNLYSGRRMQSAGEASGRVQSSFYNNYMNILQNMADPTPASNLASMGVGQGVTMGNQNIAATNMASNYMMDAATTNQNARSDFIGGVTNAGTAMI